MAFNFGTGTQSTTQPSLFGKPASTASTGFTGFGTGTGGLGTFGGAGTGLSTTAAVTKPGFSGFGLGLGTATTTTASSFNMFGTTTTSASPFTFNTAATSAPSLNTGFGGFGTTAGGGFGGTGTSGFGGFGTTGTGVSAFGTGAGTGPGLLGNNPGAQLKGPEVDPASLAMTTHIYGDERDGIIAKWNQLQAMWGTGKGFYASVGVVDFKPENPYCRFKAIGYHLIPKGDNESGLVALVLARKEAEVTSAQQQIMDTLHKILGSKPTINVCVEGVRPLPEDKTEIVIYILERPVSGPAKRVPANDLYNFFSQATQKTQISSQLNVESMMPKVAWTKEHLKAYLDKPPSGVDPLLWEQAKLDNPDPDKYIPVPMIGFKELQKRLQHQAEQTKLYQQRLDVISGDLADLQTQHSTMLSKLEDYKRKDLELGHRLLKVIVKQEIYRKMGYAIQVEEETLKVQLEQLQVELNHPTQFKGRLNELMSHMRMQLQMVSGRSEPSYTMDLEMQAAIRLMLKQQQDGLQHLISIIKEDAADLQLIEQGITKSQAR